jgi:FkbM family methyltransferase
MDYSNKAYAAIKLLASKLPFGFAYYLKRFHCAIQMRTGTFGSPEPEYTILDKFIMPGNWIIDVGANVGRYSKRFSELAGTIGRVIAFEPINETFALLVANLKRAKCTNVTFINAAASDKSYPVKMIIPFQVSGLKTSELSHIRSDSEEDNGFEVLALSIDTLKIPHSISLVKIDVEGHEYEVLIGMLELINRDHPILIIETGTPQVVELLTSIGYTYERIKGSPNVIFRPSSICTT